MTFYEETPTSTATSPSPFSSSPTTPAAARVNYIFLKQVGQMRLLVLVGVLLTGHFVWWFADADHVGYAPLFWLLSVSLGFKLLRMLHEWYHYVSVSEPVAPAGPLPHFTVDVLTTFCPGEPYVMMEETLRAMQAITYPHTSYLCDEADDAYLRQLCQQLGIVHVTRQHKLHAKAGNINHALQQATGQLCVVLDPDHVPAPDFLDHVVPYFSSPTVGYVQVVQAYGNQAESLVARGAAEQTYHFYGPLMMGMNRYNTAQAIGANCTFRRAALDSIGGHAAGLTEDMHTAMRLHAQGWQSVYVPRILSRGLVPATLGAFYAQQLKWARGAFELLGHVYPRLFTRFTLRQKLHYATLPLYFLSGLVTLIDLAVPIASLFLSVYPWHVALDAFFLHLAPLLGIGLLIRYKAQQWLREPQEMGLHLAGGILRVGTWWVYLLGLVYTFLRVRVPYIPTPKEGNTRNELKICLPNILTIVLCAVAVKYAGRVDWSPYSRLMAFLATSNAAILFAAVGMGQHTWVRNMLNDFSTRPLSGLVAAGQKIVQTLTVRTQTAGISLATGSLLLVGGIDAAQYIEKQLTGLSATSWVVNGGEKPHLGVQRTTSSPTLPVPISSFTTHRLLASYSSESAPAVVGLSMTDKVPTDEMAALYEQGSIPLLTWTVTGASGANWPQMVQAFKALNRPVLLRPVLPTLPPDQYRKAWHQLVWQFQTAKISGIVWVWTPPTATAVQTHFPGKKYVDWVAIDKEEEGISGQNFLATYLPYRHEFAANLALHDKPVMLLGADQRFKNRRQAELITQRFPEIKAIILHAEEHPKSTRLLTSRIQSSLNAVSSN